ncbi:PadR family transcriptional regulator [Gloeobacter violaceus]|nr:helix-turn-helix transcriptional regulator [Gloeobacter violaceus]
MRRAYKRDKRAMFFPPKDSDSLALTAAMFHILLSLADGDSHGYAISKDIERRTDGHLRLGTGAFYRIVKQMLAAGWVEEAGEQEALQTDGLRRRFYRLTPLGREVGRAEAGRLAALVELARQKHFLPGLEGS